MFAKLYRQLHPQRQPATLAVIAVMGFGAIPAAVRSSGAQNVDCIALANTGRLTEHLATGHTAAMSVVYALYDRNISNFGSAESWSASADIPIGDIVAGFAGSDDQSRYYSFMRTQRTDLDQKVHTADRLERTIEKMADGWGDVVKACLAAANAQGVYANLEMGGNGGTESANLREFAVRIINQRGTSGQSTVALFVAIRPSIVCNGPNLSPDHLGNYRVRVPEDVTLHCTRGPMDSLGALVTISPAETDPNKRVKVNVGGMLLVPAIRRRVPSDTTIVVSSRKMVFNPKSPSPVSGKSCGGAQTCLMTLTAAPGGGAPTQVAVDIPSHPDWMLKEVRIYPKYFRQPDGCDGWPAAQDAPNPGLTIRASATRDSIWNGTKDQPAARCGATVQQGQPSVSGEPARPRDYYVLTHPDWVNAGPSALNLMFSLTSTGTTQAQPWLVFTDLVVKLTYARPW